MCRIAIIDNDYYIVNTDFIYLCYACFIVLLYLHISVFTKNPIVIASVKISVSGAVAQTPFSPKNRGRVKINARRITKPRAMEITAEGKAFPQLVKYIEATTLNPINMNDAQRNLSPVVTMPTISLSFEKSEA